jgi:hypothetical protein
LVSVETTSTEYLLTTVTTTTSTSYYVSTAVTVVGGSGGYVPPFVPAPITKIAIAGGALDVTTSSINEASGSWDVTIFNHGDRDVTVLVDYWVTNFLDHVVFRGTLTKDPKTGQPIRLKPGESATFPVLAKLVSPGDYVFYASAKFADTGVVGGTASQAFTAGIWDIYTYSVLVTGLVAICAVLLVWRREQRRREMYYC